MVVLAAFAAARVLGDFAIGGGAEGEDKCEDC